MQKQILNSDEFLVSLIVAAKNPSAADLALCLSSFSALKYAKKIQLILVESGEPVDLYADFFKYFADVKRLSVPANGVYSAYNSGIEIADGNYLLFFGVDDIALPGMDKVIANLEGSGCAFHLYAAACYMQATGIKFPSSHKTSLIFSNWCHQGIFYLRKTLREKQYDLRYRMQADHKMNIDIVSNSALRFGVSRELVAYFSAGGVSSMSPDLVFRKDFSMIVGAAYGWHWGWFVRLKQVLVDIFMGSPEKRFKSHVKN